jgi:hypothetical protein
MNSVPSRGERVPEREMDVVETAGAVADGTHGGVHPDDVARGHAECEDIGREPRS